MNNFDKALAAANIVEEYVAEKIGGERLKGYVKEGDIMLEVKEDLKCQKTNSVAFEYKFKGEASGVFASESMFIIYKVIGRFWIIRRQKLLKELRELYDNNGLRFLPGGDGGHSDLILMNFQDFVMIFKELDLE